MSFKIQTYEAEYPYLRRYHKKFRLIISKRFMAFLTILRIYRYRYNWQIKLTYTAIVIHDLNEKKLFSFIN
jgi:hypothetical protein